jgi:predicted acyl esterase
VHGTTCATSAATRQLCQQAGLTGAAPEPAGGPHGTALRAAASAEHFDNANLVAMAQTGVYRDWARGPQSWTVASVGSKTAAIGAGRVPVLTFAGWLDAGTANGVLSQFASLPNTQQEWIAPWSHGQGYLADPFQPSRPLTPPSTSNWPTGCMRSSTATSNTTHAPTAPACCTTTP